MVVWIIGLSGAGKSTLANEVVNLVQNKKKNIVLIDGDMVREAFGNDLGYSMADRNTNARRVCQLGKFLDEQGINVVCAILSLFPETQLWNRRNLGNYYEVFIDTPLSDLIKRDSKGIYRKFNNGELFNVAGMDLDFVRPETPDLVIHNVNSKDELLSYAKTIADRIISEDP